MAHNKTHCEERSDGCEGKVKASSQQESHNAMTQMEVRWATCSGTPMSDMSATPAGLKDISRLDDSGPGRAHQAGDATNYEVELALRISKPPE